MEKKFTHLDAKGNYNMVDVSDKVVTKRTAIAQSKMILPDEILSQFENGDLITKKGSVLQIAQIAGIMATKKTSELIPLCHPLSLEQSKVQLYFNEDNELIIECEATISSKTGVEMEALVGATIAALTVYDMCKAFSQNIVIKETRLIEKRGGKSDYTLNLV